MNLLSHNPYRVLGVMANAPVKERVANQAKIKAFLKVGKPISFPLDLEGLLPPPLCRTQESVDQAAASLTLPQEQVRHAQFWFLCITPLDHIAFRHLFAGDAVAAVALWEKRDTLSSLQNRIIVALAYKSYYATIRLAETLYERYSADFVDAIVGTSSSVKPDTLAFTFLDTLVEEVGLATIMPHLNEEWRTHIAETSAGQVISQLNIATEQAKKATTPEANLQAGQKLMNAARPLLQKLRTFISTASVQYQTISDKVGQQVQYCATLYYNGSDDPEAAYKTLPLQQFAVETVVGQLAKESCQRHLKDLNEIIAQLPPEGTYTAGKAVKNLLTDYCQKEDTITCATSLLRAASPHLQIIQKNVGTRNTYYLRLSTDVIAEALNKIIKEVNDTQASWRKDLIHSTMKSAYATLSIMDSFDMEEAFKRQRYAPQRAKLVKLWFEADFSHIQTNSPPPRPATTSQPTSTPKTEDEPTLLEVVYCAIGAIVVVILFFICCYLWNP